MKWSTPIIFFVIVSLVYRREVAAQGLLPHLDNPAEIQLKLIETLENLASESVESLLPRESFEIMVGLSIEKIKGDHFQVLPNKTRMHDLENATKKNVGAMGSFKNKKNILIVVDPDNLPSGDQKKILLGQVQDVLIKNLDLNLESERDVVVIREAQIIPRQSQSLARNFSAESQKDLARVRKDINHVSLFWNLGLVLFILGGAHVLYRYRNKNRHLYKLINR